MADTASPVVSESTIMLSLWSLVVQLQGNTVTLTLPQCTTSSELLYPLGLWTATPGHPHPAAWGCCTSSCMVLIATSLAVLAENKPISG